MTAESVNERLFALDYGIVMRIDGDTLAPDDATPDPKWLDALEEAGMSPCRAPKPPLPQTEGATLRMVPFGLMPHVTWSSPFEAGGDASAQGKGHEDLFPVPPSGNGTPWANPGTTGPSLGQVLRKLGHIAEGTIKVVNGLRYVWKFGRWLLVDP